MLSLVISLAAAVLAAALLKLTHAVRSDWALVFPALVVFVGVAALLLRRAARQIEPLMKSVEKHLLGNRREMALSTLREGLSIGRWHPLLPAQLRVQIGTLEYVSGNLEEAEQELAKASRWPWQSRAYLGCVYFKRRNNEGMKKAFETAVSVGKKEGLAWTLYAWCLVAQNKREEAVAVLERALKEIPGDHRLEANLELAKESKKLKVAPYGDQWAAFALESEGPPVPRAARGFAQRPGFRQRPIRRK